MPFICGVDWEERCECRAPAARDGGKRLLGDLFPFYACHEKIMKELEKHKPEGESMGDPTRGLYHKFNVTRTDGKSAVGEKHDGCDYFILDLTHDPHAIPALQAYVCSLERSREYPLLALDLRDKIRALIEKRCAERESKR